MSQRRQPVGVGIKTDPKRRMNQLAVMNHYHEKYKKNNIQYTPKSFIEDFNRLFLINKYIFGNVCSNKKQNDESINNMIISSFNIFGDDLYQLMFGVLNEACIPDFISRLNKLNRLPSNRVVRLIDGNSLHLDSYCWS